MSEDKVKPFGMRDKLGYMFGDFGNDFTFIFSSMLLMKFYSDVMGIDTALIAERNKLSIFKSLVGNLVAIVVKHDLCCRTLFGKVF